MTKQEEFDEAFLDFVADLAADEILEIPGVYKPLVKYYTAVLAAEATYRPVRNPVGVVKTAQDERDWKKAKEYYARGARGPESSWESPDWATVMVIFKNIKAKRTRR
jgi:hypothetical protein